MMGDANTNNKEWLHNVEDEELGNVIAQTKAVIRLTKCENEIFKKFLSKVETKIEQEIHDSQTKTTSTRKRSKSRSSASDRPMKLDWDQKCHIAQVEHEVYKTDSENAETRAKKIIATQQAHLEELNIRNAEHQKMSLDFEKLVVKDGFNSWTKAVGAEKFIRFVDEAQRQRATILDKIRLNNSSSHNQLKKLREQLRQKEEVGEVLHAVDFEQLKIDNTQCLATIDEKNNATQRLKLVAGRTLQNKLNELTQEGKRLEVDINQRMDISRRAMNETVLVKKELTNERQVNLNSQDHINSYRVPAVTDFVQLKCKERELARMESIHERKLKIAEMAYLRNKKLCSRVCGEGTAGAV